MLVVEDHEPTRRLLQVQLKDLFEVKTASGKEEAKREVRKEDFDLLLADIQLDPAAAVQEPISEKEGLSLLQEIQKRGVLRDAHVVAVTAYDTPEDREHILRAGFDAHLPKPYRKEELFSTLREVLPREDLPGPLRKH